MKMWNYYVLLLRVCVWIRFVGTIRGSTWLGYKFSEIYGNFEDRDYDFPYHRNIYVPRPVTVLPPTGPIPTTRASLLTPTTQTPLSTPSTPSSLTTSPPPPSTRDSNKDYLVRLYGPARRVFYTTKPEIAVYSTRPEIIRYTTKPEIVRYDGPPGNREIKCPNHKICARKCCPLGMGFNFLHNTCDALPDEFNPSVWKHYSAIKGFNALKEFHILEDDNIDCLPSNSKLVTDITKDFHLLTDGTLFVESHRAAGPGLVYRITEYCIDRFITADNKTEWNAFICHVKNNFERNFVLTGSCMLITCFLVLLRVIVFAWLPELRTLHGMILMAYLISFLVGFLLLGSKMILMYEQNISREICVVLSFIVYFFILSAFFWRNVMCYDIWWTFSGKRAKSGRGSNSRARLYLYCAHAFGGPTALTILLAALEYTDLETEDVLMPKVWHHGCNSLYGYSKLIYFYGPIVILFVINMVLFTLTALKIAAVKKETKVILQSNESGTHDLITDERRFKLYVNLFVVMTFLEVNWILEIITIFFPNAATVLLISDLYNVGVLSVILANFLCQKQTWKMIKKRYQQMRGLSTSRQVKSISTSCTSMAQTLQSQDYTIASNYTRGKVNPTESQNDTQSPDCSRGNTNSTESIEDTITIEYSQEKLDHAQSQDDTQSLDFNRDMTNPAESQNDTITIDYRRDKTNPAKSQDDSMTTEYSQDETNHAGSQDDTKTSEYSRDKTNPVESQDDTRSPNFNRDMPNSAESQNDTTTIEYSRDKTNPVESQDDIRSPNFNRDMPNSAESQNDTTTIEYRRDKTYPAEIQDDTIITEYRQDKTNADESQDDITKTDYRRGKTNSAESQDDTQLLVPDFNRDVTNPAVYCQECRKKMNHVGARMALIHQTSVKRSRTLPRPRRTL